MCCVGCVFPCRLYSDRHFNVLLSLKSTHASSERTFQIRSVGQNPIYTVYIYTVFWQGNHRIYGHIRCIYTVLANPTDMLQISQASWLSVSLANVLCACVAVLSVPVRGPPLAKTASVLTYIYNEVCVCVCNVMLGLLFNSFVVAHPFAFISHWLTLFCAHVVAMSRARLLFIPSVAFISPHWLTLLCAQVVAMSRARLLFRPSICFHFSSLAHPSFRTGGGHVSCQAVIHSIHLLSFLTGSPFFAHVWWPCLVSGCYSFHPFAFISPHWLTLLCAQVVAMSRARLGLYIVGRQSLFANCFELQPVFK